MLQSQLHRFPNHSTLISRIKIIMHLKKISELNLKDLACVCDHTFLMPPQAFKAAGNAIQARRQAFYNFMEASINIQPYAICVRAEDVQKASIYLHERKSPLKIAATVGFPDGSWHSTDYKIMQTQAALREGADQIDMVLNYDNSDEQIIEDIYKVRDAMKKQKQAALLKVIFETSQLPVYKQERQLKLKSYIKICRQAEVDFIKTSTGFSKSGAQEIDAFIMRQNFNKGVKISGGVSDKNVHSLLKSISGRSDGFIKLDPMKIRIGESSLLKIV